MNEMRLMNAQRHARTWTSLVAAMVLGLGLSLVLGLSPSPQVQAHAQNWTEIKWQGLVPKGWDPSKSFKGFDLSKLQDSDPQADAMLKKMREVWDAAPVNESLNGQKVRIAGFAIPIERKGERVKEFLLVPYFGACIHTPPPPANQIVHAKATRYLDGVQMMLPLWVYGTIQIQRSNTDWGVAGYSIAVDKVEAY